MPTIAESEVGDEKTETGNDSRFQGGAQCINTFFPERGERDRKEDYSGCQHDREGSLPDDRIAGFRPRRGGAGAHYAEQHEKIFAHARCESERIIGDQSHQEAACGGCQTGRCDERSERHSGFRACQLARQQSRLHANDIRHRGKGGSSGEELGTDTAPLFGNVKKTVQFILHVDFPIVLCC